MAKNRIFRITSSKIRPRRNKVTWYRSNMDVTQEDIEYQENAYRTEKYRELFKQTSLYSVEMVEKLIINLLSDPSTSISRDEKSYEINYEVDNKDESYMNIIIYKCSTEIAVRINEELKMDTDLQYSLFDVFEKRLDNMYIEQELKKLNSCISEFYNITSLDRKDKIKKMLE